MAEKYGIAILVKMYVTTPGMMCSCFSSLCTQHNIQTRVSMTEAMITLGLHRYCFKCSRYPYWLFKMYVGSKMDPITSLKHKFSFIWFHIKLPPL
jgi:hypothetical protein